MLTYSNKSILIYLYSCSKPTTTEAIMFLKSRTENTETAVKIRIIDKTT